MIRVSRKLSAVAKYALGSSNCSVENDGVNSAWYLILDAIDVESGIKVPRSPAIPNVLKFRSASISK